jgi:hypothetical protein
VHRMNGRTTFELCLCKRQIVGEACRSSFVGGLRNPNEDIQGRRRDTVLAMVCHKLEVTESNLSQ